MSALSGSYLDTYEWAYGKPFENGSLPEIAAKMREAGEGSVAMIDILRDESAHVAVLETRDGEVIYYEGQTDRAEIVEGDDLSRETNAKYAVLIVKDARRRELAPTEELTREILWTIDDQDYSPERYAENLKTRPAVPRGHSDALRKQAHQGFRDLPDVAKAVEVGQKLTGLAPGERRAVSPQQVAATATATGLTATHWQTQRQIKVNGRPSSMANDGELRHMFDTNPNRILLATDDIGRSFLMAQVNGRHVYVDTGGRSAVFTDLPKTDLDIIDVTGVDPATLAVTTTPAVTQDAVRVLPQRGSAPNRSTPAADGGSLAG